MNYLKYAKKQQREQLKLRRKMAKLKRESAYSGKRSGWGLKSLVILGAALAYTSQKTSLLDPVLSLLV